MEETPLLGFERRGPEGEITPTHKFGLLLGRGRQRVDRRHNAENLGEEGQAVPKTVERLGFP